MAHVFLNTTSFNGNHLFGTSNAILTTTPYKPKVLIVGTYNDGNNPTNRADFFYGRNYFWPILENFGNNNHLLTSKRVYFDGPLKPPGLGRILQLCDVFKLTFGDLIQNVLTPLPNHDDDFLNNAVSLGQTVNNDVAITNFINDTPSITHVYLTATLRRLPYLLELWSNIVAGSRRNVSFGKILTPSGRGELLQYLVSTA